MPLDKYSTDKNVEKVLILKAGTICIKKVAIVGLFQVQNHNNKLFEKIK